jgi:hypothetical protein
VRGEFGEFPPAAAESLGKKSSQVVAAELSEPTAQSPADMPSLTDVEGIFQQEMPMDHIIREFVEAQPEAWKQAHLVCCNDRQHGYVVAFTAAALDTLVQECGDLHQFRD